MARHLPSVVWGLRWPRGDASTHDVARNGHVRTVGRSDVELALYGSEWGWPLVRRGSDGFAVTLDRRTARLLAKRILACLDETQ